MPHHSRKKHRQGHAAIVQSAGPYEAARHGAIFMPAELAKYLSVKWGMPLHDARQRPSCAKTKEKAEGSATGQIRIQQPDLSEENKYARLLSLLGPHEKNLVAHCTSKGERCGTDELKQFIGMHAGVRELRMRNFISMEWSGSDWKTNITAFSDSKENLYRVCGISRPTATEKLKAAMNTNELSDRQCAFVAAFGADPKSISSLHVAEFKKRLASLSPSELAGYWRRNRIDFMAMADLAYHARFSLDPVFSGPELKLVELIRGIMDGGPGNPQHLPLKLLRDSFESATCQMVSQNGRPLDINVYQPAIFAAWLLNERFPLTHRSLAESARLESEFNTLAEFLGFDIPAAEGRLDYSCSVTKAGVDEAGRPKANDDSSSGALVTLRDGMKIRLDAVWDGMGGHQGGQVASGIAKEIFELAAMAGWIRTPEDARRVLIMSDIAIVFAQIGNKYDIADSKVRDQKRLASHPQADNMGTTAVVSFQCGDELFVLHAGDSEFGLYDGGKQSAYLHLNHDMLYYSSVDTAFEDAWSDIDGQMRLRGVRASHQQQRAMAQQRAEEYVRSQPRIPFVSNVIVSSLGCTSRFIQINGLTWGYKPIIVPKDATLLLCSDGISDVVCQHEIAEIIRSSDADLAKARTLIMDLAASRVNCTERFKPACGCELDGKPDDKTLVLRRREF